MIAIINGPNLNLLGKRQPEIYGTRSFDDFIHEIINEFPTLEIQYYQSNVEGELVDAIQRAGFDPQCGGIILNPGGYTHYSVAIADAVAAVPVPVVEVHISNIHGREEYRRKSVTAEKAEGVIAGLGLDGYRLALRFLLDKAASGSGEGNEPDGH